MKLITSIAYCFLTQNVNGPRIKGINIYILDKTQKLHQVMKEDFANGYYYVNVIASFFNQLFECIFQKV